MNHVGKYDWLDCISLGIEWFNGFVRVVRMNMKCLENLYSFMWTFMFEVSNVTYWFMIWLDDYMLSFGMTLVWFEHNYNGWKCIIRSPLRVEFVSSTKWHILVPHRLAHGHVDTVDLVIFLCTRSLWDTRLDHIVVCPLF